ncbi:hypothetical protein [Tenacibaculum agarivorans]|uniref:hypothetical protein n=1 Tax=Tenacibaculum agarivorans TaxID=1908389 RepID=UPI00094BC18C|nr:hypothetical protein [Tenacibaculum agarivorans]
MRERIKELRSELNSIIEENDEIIDVTQYGDEKQIRIVFGSISKMEKRYDSWKSLAHSTNFRGNPYENNSYMKIVEGKYLIVIYPPTYLNGDSNWTAYKVNEIDYLHTIATISLFKRTDS